MIFFSSSIIQSIIVILAAVFVSSSSATYIRLAPTAGASSSEIDDYSNDDGGINTAAAAAAAEVIVVNGINKKYLVYLKEEGLGVVDHLEMCASLANSTGVGDMIVVDPVNKYLDVCFMTFLLPTTEAAAVEAALETLKSDPSVEYVIDEEDDEFYDDYLDDDEDEDEDEVSDNIFLNSAMGASEETPNFWGRNCINQCSPPLDNDIAEKQDATGVKVFILDDGIYRDNTEFEGIMGPKECHFDAFPNFESHRKHGTHVAGIACGAKHGVASNCILCDVRVLSGNWNRKSNIHHILQGLNHVLAQCKGGRDLCVINTSIGGVNRINWDVRSKVEELVFAGISVVVAGGNKKPNRDPPVVDACIKTYSSSPFAIVVGSMGRNNEVYGNYGPCITVYAPGIGIWSAGTDSPTDIVQKSGSSMATPFVAGIVAGIRSRNPNMTPYQIKEKIKSSAIWLPDANEYNGLNVYMATVGDSNTQNCPAAPVTYAPTWSPTYFS